MSDLTSETGTEEILEPRVVCAAVRLKSGVVVCGVRHFDQIMRALLPPNDEEGRMAIAGAEQGFVDNSYRFISRQEAWQIAVGNGQVNPYSPKYRGLKGTLFSEDLY